ncbi:MAG TPA: hypothetical protein VFZ31_16210 [Vicinamibacterales bacterium]
MKTAIALAFSISLATGMSTVSAQAQADGKKYEKGSTVTLQGCVVAAEKKDTYVLTNVREWPIANSDMGKFGKRYYWIEKTDKMKPHAGHTIQLTGKITSVEKSEIEFKAGESGNGINVEIEGPGRDVVTPAPNAAVPTPPAGHAGKEMPITLLKLKVDDIKMTSATCSPTM